MLKHLLKLSGVSRPDQDAHPRTGSGNAASRARADAPVKRNIGLGGGVSSPAQTSSPAAVAAVRGGSSVSPAPAASVTFPQSDSKVVSLRDARSAAHSAKLEQSTNSRSSPVPVPASSPLEAVVLQSDQKPRPEPRLESREDDQPAARQAPPKLPSVATPASPEVLISSSALPEGCTIASDSGPASVSDALRKEMAVLSIGATQSVVLVVTNKHFRAASHVALLGRIKKAGLTVEKEFIADSGLITSLYSASSDRDTAVTDSGLARDLDRLVGRALEINASDIHVMIRQEATNVKMRRNGRLTDITQWQSAYAREMIRAIHAIADQDTKEPIFSELEGQSMMVSRYIGGQLVKLRCQTTPIYPGGMDFVARVLKSGSNSKPIPFEKLGYARSHIEMLEWMMRAPWGVTIFAGETGSGKSTSLFTMMTELAASNSGSKMYTVEDPPEYNMEPYGISQIPASAKRGTGGSPFSNALRALMRLDPDLAMVGEIRDADSAEAVVNLVRSGHKIVSTLHASGALPILERLLTFGVDINTMTSRGFIAGLIAQRLAPILCRHCKVDYSPHMDLPISGIHERIKAVTTDGDTLFVAGAGCEHCGGTGISGQTVLAEMVIVDGKLLELLRASDFNGAYEHWRSFRQPTIADIDGSMVGMTMLEHGILKMRKGLLAPDELELRVGPLTDSTEVNEAIIGHELQDLMRN